MDGTVSAENFQENTLGGMSVNQKKDQKKDSTTFENRWLLTSSYATRNADCIPQIKIKHNFFKNTFFPSPIIEWKKLDPAIQNAESLDIFKSNTLKIFRPTPKSFFSCYNHKGIG